MAEEVECPKDRPLKHWTEEELKDMGDIAAVGSDSAWHLATNHGFCGGCGDEASTCHPDRCCTEVRDRLGALESVCGMCPTRVATGQIKEIIL